MANAKGEHNSANRETEFTCIFQVPLQTSVHDIDTGELLVELNSEGQSYVLARGGAGGKGNHYFLSNEV